MTFLNSISLLLNGLTIALALSFLVITLWQDIQKQLNQLFAIFLLLVTLWNVGALLLQAMALVDARPALISFAIGLVELGFTGSSIAIYSLTAILVGIHTRRFRWLVFIGLLLVLGYQILLVVSNTSLHFQRLGGTSFIYQPQLFSVLFYLIFDTGTFYLAWRYRRKIRSNGLSIGIMVFVAGQAIGLFNPALGALSLAINLSSVAALVISFAILRREIITPLAERVAQIEAMHKVSLAITSQIGLNTVLNQIATQAVGWLDADAASIFLRTNDQLHLAAVFNLPTQYIDLWKPLEKGVAGTVIGKHKSIYVENYARDWHGEDELPLARETFGSVICVPLIYGADAIGALMVIAGQQGRLFSRDDVHLLEMLGSQAAVAIAHSKLFAEQQDLTSQVEAAHGQLETVLTSTENPVIAVDRQFRLIFVNPAAETVFSLPKNRDGAITEMLPGNIFPADQREALSHLRRNRTYAYEISLKGKVYLCHIACLGRPRIQGWVAILNDVTQLKELDRIKSEMVRMTSHDLKNPIQAAMANLELLRDDLMDIQNPEIQESVDTIDTQLNRMNRIISGILDLERVKSGAQLSEICSPEMIVSHTIEEMQHLARDNQITLQESVSPALPYFQGDPEQFERALINLVENAIKFTPRGGIVTVKAYSGDSQENIVFEVADTGIGIPSALHEQVFERFFRGRQKGVEHVSGSGLGLSLVKTIVENHHGKISLISEAGQGTTFVVSVPALSTQQMPT